MVSNADKKNAMLYILLMLLAGCMIAMQSPLNAALSRTVGVLESCLISFAVGTLFLALTVLFFGRGQLPRVTETPPWQWIGGSLGAVMVLNTIIAVPRIGVLTTVLAMIFGNLVMAAVIDNFGWFGLPVTPFGWRRLAGFALVLAGLLLVFRR